MLTYEQALAKHSGCFIDLRYRVIDTSYPNHQEAPVATAPAIFVWPEEEAAKDGNEAHCVAIYWLRDED